MPCQPQMATGHLENRGGPSVLATPADGHAGSTCLCADQQPHFGLGWQGLGAGWQGVGAGWQE